MTERSKAQRAAERRNDAKRRGQVVSLRLNKQEADWLQQRQRPDESRATAIKRLCGLSPNAGVQR